MSREFRRRLHAVLSEYPGGIYQLAEDTGYSAPAVYRLTAMHHTGGAPMTILTAIAEAMAEHREVPGRDVAEHRRALLRAWSEDREELDRQIEREAVSGDVDQRAGLLVTSARKDRVCCGCGGDIEQGHRYLTGLRGSDRTPVCLPCVAYMARVAQATPPGRVRARMGRGHAKQ